MKDWWNESRAGADNYLQVGQKQFRSYKYNIYILNKVHLR